MLFLSMLVIGTVPNHKLIALTQHEKRDMEQKMRKIMVMYLGSNYEKRKLVESEVTYYINDAGFEAQQSSRYFQENKLPDTESIIRMLEENKFDGLLVIEVVDVDLKKERVNAHMTYGPGRGAPYMYDYFSIYRRYSEGYDRIETAFELETSLFRLEDKSLVYSNSSKAYNKGDIDIALEGFAKATAKKLKNSKTMLKTK